MSWNNLTLKRVNIANGAHENQSGLDMQSFPISSKFHWTVGPVNIKLLPAKQNSPDSMWSMADSYLVKQKKKRTKNKTDQTNDRIVGPMWLGILPYLPLFYLTCPTLLGKTGHEGFSGTMKIIS